LASYTCVLYNKALKKITAPKIGQTVEEPSKQTAPPHLSIKPNEIRIPHHRTIISKKLTPEVFTYLFESCSEAEIKNQLSLVAASSASSNLTRPLALAVTNEAKSISVKLLHHQLHRISTLHFQQHFFIFSYSINRSLIIITNSNQF
jgi:hypothetical protein